MNFNAAKNLVECNEELCNSYRNLITIVERVCPSTECSKCSLNGYMDCKLLDILESIEKLLDVNFVSSVEKEKGVRGVVPEIYSDRDWPYCRRAIRGINEKKKQHWYSEVHSTEQARLGVKDGSDW